LIVLFEIDDDLIIEKSTFYFVSNINLGVRLDSLMLSKLKENGVIVDDYSGEDERGKYLSGFFTKHYVVEHNPLNFQLGKQEAIVDLEKLREIDKSEGFNRFQDLILNEEITICWKTCITANGIGTLIFEMKTMQPLHQKIHRKLSLIYLTYPIIKTDTLEYLFKTNGNSTIPKYITIGDLIAKFESELIQKLKLALVKIPKHLQTDYSLLPHMSPKKFMSLKFDTIIPIIYISVKKDDTILQSQWLEQHKKLIAYYVMKPELFEMDELSDTHITEIFSKENIFSISKRSLSINNYHGLVRIGFKKENENYHSPENMFSGFWMEAQNSYLFSVLIALQTYFTLRIFDDYLDHMTDIIYETRISHLHERLSEEEQSMFAKMKDPLNKLDFISKILSRINDQMEEIDNVDKLIDSDPHIQLVYKVMHVFEISKWKAMLLEKLKAIEKYSENIDYIQDNRSGKKLETILLTIAILDILFGLIQSLGVFGILPI
jgi:hypothetical protein